MANKSTTKKTKKNTLSNERIGSYYVDTEPSDMRMKVNHKYIDSVKNDEETIRNEFYKNKKK